MKPFIEGARVWYEPSPGLRFAGRVIGDGTLPGTYKVRLTGHYHQWKSRSGTRAKFTAVDAPAISGDMLSGRTEHNGFVDLVSR